ncbi:glycosyltransferase family 4 protein [Paenibacillus sp. D9]|uniref:glycosyltransferase family 4 protein n=1 Tax=Paenibacillus sp. D9 TaxID=665792 RepID=UPI0006762EE2|nr:glycosyltransferase family 1 protein [Paenibacillus sp. D9]
MKVLMDGMPLLGRKTGIGYYVENLYRHVSTDPDVELELVCNGFGFSKEMKTETHTLRKAPFPYDLYRTKFHNKFLYNTFHIERFMGRFDVFHGTNYVLIPTKRAKKIVTIHDLSFVKYPQFVPKIIVDHHTEWSRYAAKESDLIIVDSFSTGNDLQEYFGVKEDKLVCVHLAASSRYCPRKKAEVQDVRERYNLPERFILFVGTIEKRKNVLNLVRAFAQAKRKDSIAEKLVLVGGMGLGHEEVLDAVEKLGIQDDVVFPGYVRDEDLPKLYNLATLFAYISYYEGFGLPLLEALQSGVPVISSTCSSLPEVVGSAGIQVEPDDIDGIAKSITDVLSSKEARERMIQEGLIQASIFSWERAAKETIETYKRI